jgi:hypothetical protein
MITWEKLQEADRLRLLNKIKIKELEELISTPDARLKKQQDKINSIIAAMDKVELNSIQYSILYNRLIKQRELEREYIRYNNYIKIAILRKQIYSMFNRIDILLTPSSNEIGG